MPGITTRTTHTEESAEVEVLLANMEKLKGLTKRIEGSLTRLDVSGANLQDAIRPIYGNTTNLQTMNGNIDKINKAIERIRQPMDDHQGEEKLIRNGLERTDLSSYLAAMDKANRALTNLQRTNMKANQSAIADLQWSLKTGNENLQNAFQQALSKESQPLEPLQYVTKQIPFPTISQSNSSYLRTINAYISQSSNQRQKDGHDPKTLRIYAEQRGTYLSKSLQNLATASVVTVRKTNPDAIYRQGTSGIVTYARALEDLIVAEHESICPIFSRDQWSHLHSLTCQDSIKELTRTLAELHQHILENPITDSFLAYEIHGVIFDLAYRLEQRNPELKDPILSALRPIRETGKYSFYRLYNDARRRANGVTSLSPDAAPVSVTNDTMNRLQNMVNYLDPVSKLLADIGDGGWKSEAGVASPATTSRPPDVGVDGTELFGNYSLDTMITLLEALENRSKGIHRNKSAHGIFLANNLALVDRIVETSELSSRLPSKSRSDIDNFRKRAIFAYTEPWNEAGRHLLDVTHTNRVSGASSGPRASSGSVSGGGGGDIDSAAFIKSLNSKDKEAIKEKFRNFNATFDDLVMRHRGLRTEPEVKETMIREIERIVLPLYDRFWDRYHEIDKGKGKVVKYDKGMLRSTLRTLTLA